MRKSLRHGVIPVLPLLMGMALSACGGGTAQTLVRIMIDATKLSAEDRARVTSIALTFQDGTSDAAMVPAVNKVAGLPTGMFETVIQPRITQGVLTINAALNDDVAGVVIATQTAKVTVRKGNQVIAMLKVGGPDDDGGVLPPLGDAAIDLDPDAGAVDAAQDATSLDAPTLDLESIDVGGDCNAVACSGAAADGCCPATCTATTDRDCAGCGNGKLDPGETCDPRDMCPAACPQMACQLFTLAQPGTCQAACMPASLQTTCTNADGCCPPGCTTANDSDCSASCGNGTVEGQEVCDGACPSKCDPMGCQLRVLQGSASTCSAVCANGAMQTACASGDGCCPPGCDLASDADCGLKCGNGAIEAGELCDGNCPTECKPIGCQLRVLEGSASTCDANCVNGAMQGGCVNNDNCCPSGCTSLKDNDCKPACGNGVVEMGEVCDPPSACTAVVNACVSDVNNIATLMGSAATCTAVCKRVGRTCGPVDTFCPTAVSCGPTTDTDCPGCGNGKLEIGEACDPPSMCMTQMTGCVSDANTVATPSGSVAACTFRCAKAARPCGLADGFCPTGCGPTMDVDCPGCGNGRLETGETCDKAPAAAVCASITCDDGNACTTDTRNGSDAACNVTCGHANIMLCVSGDRCCPMGCNANNDTDCGATCGNGVLEGAETCETMAPATPQCAGITCDDGKACTTNVRNGANGSCNVTCSYPDITLCVSGDKCCPGGGFGMCKMGNDSDCPQVCGNGVREGTETCDNGNASPTCASKTCDDQNACTIDVRAGADTSCNVTCTNTPITACNPTSDGCCPSKCNATNDPDCQAVCGNSVLEQGEACEISANVTNCPNGCACPTASTCVQQACVIPNLENAGTCQAACVDRGLRQTMCLDKDGCCPAGCSDINDSDCPTPNDKCAGAIDISKGGDFPFSLMTAKQDSTEQCSPAAADVYFTFTLASASAVYLDVYDADASGNPVTVPVALELWTGGCAVLGTSKPSQCNAAEGGETCHGGKVSWPRIFTTQTDNTTYTVVARSTGKLGRFVLRFQRMPMGCLAGGALANGTIRGSNCQSGDLVTPTCRTAVAGTDTTYYVEKCPGMAMTATTCVQDTLKNVDTALQIHTGSMDLVNRRCVPAGGKTACDDDFPAGMTCEFGQSASIISNLAKADHGLYAVTVDTPVIAGACATYGLSMSVK